ncbi:MAG: DNA polymerase III subunit chi [Panacagrimonas sp.]
MTRIDFYLLPEDGNAIAIACRLCEKAVAGGSRVYVRGEGVVVDEVDGALWSFRQGGFIAHERFSGALIEEPLPPVLIGPGEPPDSHRDVMLNLGGDVPPWFSSFDRVLEIVPGDTEAKARSRERYRFYKDRGYELSTHNL